MTAEETDRMTRSDHGSRHMPPGMEKAKGPVRDGEPIAGQVSGPDIRGALGMWSAVPQLPGKYQAWVGVRFREPWVVVWIRYR